MAALSCYQPCRSHLAQPARCLDEDDFQLSTLTIRRRQFIQRCQDTRLGRNRDLIPEISVKKTRDELTKHAVQNPQLTRRLNVESGWSKVEEVRKKFEGATTTSYSRSFESPPRRRLADSLFASFKLPRKKDMSAPRSLMPQQKRKSAVELLAESKAFYVKSETVLDRKQEMPLRVSSGLSQAIAAGGCHLVSSGALSNEACCNPYATTRLVDGRRTGAPGVVVGPGVAGGPGAGGGLQSTLRRLLEHSDSRENVYPPAYVSQKMFSDTRRLKDSYPEREVSRSQHTSGTFSGTSSSGTSGSKQKSDDKNRSLSFGDTRVFFPDSFVIPRQRPSEVVIKNTYSIPSPQSSAQAHEQLAAISPPAEYAHSAHRYVRSNSHSQPSAREEDSTNINSHKSLPDLHAQAHVYPEQVNVVVCGESMGRSPRRRRHSAHHRTASCSSKGTRSNHSSLMSSCDAFSEHPSPEENYQSYNSRCGSSFARDSGGSSGHYTQRSAPPHAHHDRNRGYNYHTNSGSTLEQCYVSAPPQFQDGAPSPAPSPPQHYPPPAPPPPANHTHARVGIHFQASAPPPQFQDEPLYNYNDYDYDCTYKKPLKCITGGRKEYTREYSRYHEPSTELVSQQPQYQELRLRRIEDQEYVNTADVRQMCPPEEVTSPLGTFKRQRCLRYKQRKPRPILRSKSDISDRYRRSDGRSSSSAPCEVSPTSPSNESSRLHHFFDYLGMDSRQYDAVIRDGDDDSPVFFSSASTIDSNQVTAAADYTVQGPGVQKQIYRNTEPPSVVERNARIIKWLCQCRKAQIPPPQ